MWADLLPKMVGGTIADHDAPHLPTEIIGFTLTEDTVEVIGKNFVFGGARQYHGIRAGAAPGTFIMQNPWGMAATITMPVLH